MPAVLSLGACGASPQHQGWASESQAGQMAWVGEGPGSHLGCGLCPALPRPRTWADGKSAPEHMQRARPSPLHVLVWEAGQRLTPGSASRRELQGKAPADGATAVPKRASFWWGTRGHPPFRGRPSPPLLPVLQGWGECRERQRSGLWGAETCLPSPLQGMRAQTEGASQKPGWTESQWGAGIVGQGGGGGPWGGEALHVLEGAEPQGKRLPHRVRMAAIPGPQGTWSWPPGPSAEGAPGRPSPWGHGDVLGTGKFNCSQTDGGRPQQGELPFRHRQCQAMPMPGGGGMLHPCERASREPPQGKGTFFPYRQVRPLLPYGLPGIGALWLTPAQVAWGRRRWWRGRGGAEDARRAFAPEEQPLPTPVPAEQEAGLGGPAAASWHRRSRPGAQPSSAPEEGAWPFRRGPSTLTGAGGGRKPRGLRSALGAEAGGSWSRRPGGRGSVTALSCSFQVPAAPGGSVCLRINLGLLHHGPGSAQPMPPPAARAHRGRPHCKYARPGQAQPPAAPLPPPQCPPPGCQANWLSRASIAVSWSGLRSPPWPASCPPPLPFGPCSCWCPQRQHRDPTAGTQPPAQAFSSHSS